jgi:hypothetical protein
LEGCIVEFKDLGLAAGSLEPFKPTEPPAQRTQQSETPSDDLNTMIIVGGAVAAGMLLLFAICMARRSCKGPELCISSDDINSQYKPEQEKYEVKVDLEEGNAVAEKPTAEAIAAIEDTTSTVCPSELPSEKHSEPADDVELPRPPSVCSAQSRPQSASSEQRGSPAAPPSWLPSVRTQESQLARALEESRAAGSPRVLSPA